MNRRDFVKTGICLGCAGTLASVIPFMKKEGITNLSDIQTFLKEKKFLYTNENELPNRIRLDLCNLCQLNCAACWMRRDEEKIKKFGGGFGYVTFETFKNFIDKHPFIKLIECSHSGEIFLNPDLDKIIEYAYLKGVKLQANNGVNLNTISEKTAENLVKYQFKEFYVSIDGATPDVYAIYRRKGNLNKVINNIKTINKYKGKYNSEYPKMTYKFIVFGHNEHEIEAAKKLAKELKMEIKFEPNCVEGYSPVKNKEKVLASTGIKSLDLYIDNFIELYKSGEDDWFTCKDLFDWPQFNYNGDMFGCCVFLFKTYGVNLFKDGLLKCLNDKKVLYAKMMLTDSSVKPRDDIPCGNCYTYKVLKEKNFPIKFV